VSASDRRRRITVADGLIAAALAAVGLVDALRGTLSAPGPGSPAVGAVGVVAGAVLLSQRRLRPPLVLGVYLVWPALALVTAGDVPALFYGTFVPLLLATYSAGRHGVGPTRWLALPLLVATMAWAHLTLPAVTGWSAMAFNLAVGVAAFAVGSGLRRSEQRAVAEALRAAAHEERSRLEARAAVADERARIARDLHDLLGHSMSAMVVQAGAAEQAIGDDHEAVRRALRDIRATGSGALAEVRHVVSLLRSPDEDAGREPASRAPLAVAPGVER
jgi:signal transduction histidine kinase